MFRISSAPPRRSPRRHLPACGEKVTLTEEQRKLGRPPEMKCPHCDKPIEWEKIGTSAAAPPKMPAPKSQLPTYDFDAK